jgi:hypothetical protein
MKTDWRIELDLELQDLPALASKALQDGLDSPSLRSLAGMTLADSRTDMEIFWGKAMGELGIPRPTKEEAAWLLVEHYIDKIIRREIDPYEGLEIIIMGIYDQNLRHAYKPDEIGIDVLYSLYDIYGDFVIDPVWIKYDTNEKVSYKFSPEQEHELLEDIVEEAKRYKENYLTKRKVKCLR